MGRLREAYKPGHPRYQILGRQRVSQAQPEPQRRNSIGKHLAKFAGIIAAVIIVASISYTLGSFNARDTVSRPEMSWALGSAAAIKTSDLSISLEHAANVIRQRDPDMSEAELAKAYDYLSELLAASVEMHIAKGDPLRPAFTNWMSDYRKFLGDSPDAVYSTAPINAGIEYEIEIKAGSADYLGLVVYDRSPLTGWNRVADSVSVIPETDNSDFRIQLTVGPNHDVMQSRVTSADNNKFTAPVSNVSEATRDRPSSSPQRLALNITDGSHMLMVREYFFDSGPREPSSLKITALVEDEAVNTTEVRSTPYETRAENAVNFFNQTWQGSLALADALNTTANSFDRPATVSPDFVGIFYPTPDNDYHGGAFSLAPGEALIVEGKVPTAAFWSITLQNHWMQSIEANGQAVSLTGNQITNRQGKYRVWISETAPPSGEDWLDTQGETEGLVAIRYLLADTATSPKATLHEVNHPVEVSNLNQSELKSL